MWWTCLEKKSTGSPLDERDLMSAINENLIRDVVAEVLGRLGQAPVARSAPGTAASTKDACGCRTLDQTRPTTIGHGKHGVFQDPDEACAAAHEGFLQL